MSAQSSASPPGAGNAVRRHVVREIEVRIINPHGPAELERRETNALAIARDAVELRPEELFYAVGGRWRPFEHRHTGDVQVRDAVFEVKELRIEDAESVHGLPRLDELLKASTSTVLRSTARRQGQWPLAAARS